VRLLRRVHPAVETQEDSHREKKFQQFPHLEYSHPIPSDVNEPPEFEDCVDFLVMDTAGDDWQYYFWCPVIFKWLDPNSSTASREHFRGLLTEADADQVLAIGCPIKNLGNGFVSTEADSAKNRKGAILPLKADTADRLNVFANDRMPLEPVFRMPYLCSVVRMSHKDLLAVGIDPTDNGRGKLDFHSLRHTTGSLFAASGVHPKTTQNLLRHSTIDLTMNIYTHSVKGGKRLQFKPCRTSRN